MTKKYFHHFLPFTPGVPEGEVGDVRCLQEMIYETETDGPLTVHLLGRKQSVDVVAVSIPTAIDDEKHLNWIQKIGNHMFATLRLTYTPFVDICRTTNGFLNMGQESDKACPDYEVILIHSPHGQSIENIDAANIAAVFCQTANKEMTPIIALLAEAISPWIPMHYKILSIVRALEILIPKENERFSWLDRYHDGENGYQSTKFNSQLFRNALPAIRTRCAHGGSRGKEAPFVGQAYADSSELHPVYSLLCRVLVDKIRQVHKLDIRLN